MRAIDERASTRVERFRFGTAYFHERMPRVWSRNFLMVDEAAGVPPVQRLLADSDRLQGGAGLAHRKLVFADAAAGASAGGRLEREGWRLGRNRLMAYRATRRPQAGSAPGQVQEVDSAALVAARAEIIRSYPETRDEETVRQLLDADLVVGAVAGERCFAFLAGGAVVSYCRVYSDGTVAQIEDVATLPSGRRKGYSGAVISKALAETVRAHDLTFILADDSDWPGDWYARMGFETIGMLCELVQPRAPSGAAVRLRRLRWPRSEDLYEKRRRRHDVALVRRPYLQERSAHGRVRLA